MPKLQSLHKPSFSRRARPKINLLTKLTKVHKMEPNYDLFAPLLERETSYQKPPLEKNLKQAEFEKNLRREYLEWVNRPTPKNENFRVRTIHLFR